VTKIVLRSGAEGKAKIQLTGGGSNLYVPPLPFVTPVQVQLRTSTGGCWEATYSAGTNTTKKFKAKSD
jgi:hypothetical protein